MAVEVMAKRKKVRECVTGEIVLASRHQSSVRADRQRGCRLRILTALESKEKQAEGASRSIMKRRLLLWKRLILIASLDGGPLRLVARRRRQ